MKLSNTLLCLAAVALLSACASPQADTTGALRAAPGPAPMAASAASAPAAVPDPAAPPTIAPSASLSVTAAATGRNVPVPVPVAAAPAPAPLSGEPAAFARELAASRGLQLSAVQAALAQASYNATVARLMAPPAPPAGTKPRRNWPAYRARFVEPIRIRGGLEFWDRHEAALARAEQTYGVPASVIVAIIGVETVYGRNMGNFSVLDALYTLAFSYPPHARRDRSPYFREELGEFLAMTLSSGVDPTSVRGSYAGAIGIPQFMPGSIRRYGVAAGRSGMPDLVNDPEDAIVSVANYLAGHGWQAGHPVFPPVSLPADPAALATGGLEPTLSWSELAQAGAQTVGAPARAGLVSGNTASDTAHAWSSAPLGVIDLQNTGSATEYRVAGSNFFVITQYNRSYFYAASVADLARELEQRRAR